MKLWHIISDDSEAYVFDETAEAACEQIGRPGATVAEYPPIKFAGEQVFLFLLPLGGSPFVLPNSPLVAYWHRGDDGLARDPA